MKDMPSGFMRIRIHKDNECNILALTYVYIFIFHNTHMNINKIYITLIPLACSKV
jgi:hypothetical protein